MSIHPDIKEVLISEETLRNKIVELGKQISDDYKNNELVLVSILKGGAIFLADLSRALTIDHAFDMVGAMSYGSSTTTSGRDPSTRGVSSREYFSSASGSTSTFSGPSMDLRFSSWGSPTLL